MAIEMMVELTMMMMMSQKMDIMDDFGLNHCVVVVILLVDLYLMV
jgi:hypothetical protein